VVFPGKGGMEGEGKWGGRGGECGVTVRAGGVWRERLWGWGYFGESVCGSSRLGDGKSWGGIKKGLGGGGEVEIFVGEVEGWGEATAEV